MSKALFGTTEKSNFILNMKTASYRRCNLYILLGFLVLMPVLSVPAEFVRLYSLPLIALAVCGTAAIVFVFIGFIKSVTPKQLWLVAGLLAAFVIWGYVSMLHSFYAGDPGNYSVAIFGADGRGEGVLFLLFCSGFLLLGAQLGTDDNRLKLLHGMLLMGLAQCAWGLLQALPLGFPSYYQDLEPLLVCRVFLPSGLTGNPIFFAALLVLLEFPAMLAAAFTEDDRRRLLYLVCTAAFAVMAVKTQCLIGVAGTGLAVLLGTVYLLWKKAGRRGNTVMLTAVIAFACSIVWWGAAPFVNGTCNNTDTSSSPGLFRLYDGGIMWKDSSYRLDVSGYYLPAEDVNPNRTFDITSIPSTYGYLWRTTAKIAGDYPLTGTGPDCLVYPQLFRYLTAAQNPNTFDRAYNFYLHTAATLGFPALLLLCAVLVIAFTRGGRAGAHGGWLQTAYLGSLLLYCIVMIAGSSSITVAPLFWMTTGVCCNMEVES